MLEHKEDGVLEHTPHSSLVDNNEDAEDKHNPPSRGVLEHTVHLLDRLFVLEHNCVGDTSSSTNSCSSTMHLDSMG